MARVKNNVEFCQTRSPDGASDFQAHCIFDKQTLPNINVSKSCISTVAVPMTIIDKQNTKLHVVLSDLCM